MKKISIGSIAVVILLTLAAWSQNQPKAEQITDGPKFKQATDTTAEIAWSTTAPGSSIVKYGTSENAMNQTAEAPWGGTKESNGDYNHTVWIKNLQPNTTYFFVVVTGQGKGTGTEAQSQPLQFRTTARK